ncbi:hypothetical protein SDC9_154630 [bioreactor metagenome]|uniref:Secretion system C-terminal sorting domain-containing protein n=1 Tax=bioreactor metagenome TaxID=1076179 RepID=A0A645F424_9ZZZZ
MTEGLPKTTVIDITQTPDEKYYFAATSSGAYVYVVENKRWYEMAMPDSPDQTFWSVQYLPQSKTARFGTYGRGIWDFNIESFNSIDDNVTLPQNFVINAYPNPAKITDDFLNLKFTLKSTSYCDIRCYDAIGNLIKEDVNLLFEAGENQINYNLDEIKLSKGYYLIFIQTKDYCSFVKVVIE